MRWRLARVWDTIEATPRKAFCQVSYIPFTDHFRKACSAREHRHRYYQSDPRLVCWDERGTGSEVGVQLGARCETAESNLGQARWHPGGRQVEAGHIASLAPTVGSSLEPRPDGFGGVSGHPCLRLPYIRTRYRPPPLPVSSPIQHVHRLQRKAFPIDNVKSTRVPHLRSEGFSGSCSCSGGRRKTIPVGVLPSTLRPPPPPEGFVESNGAGYLTAARTPLARLTRIAPFARTGTAMDQGGAQPLARRAR
ncbi:hypothetical protein BC628DRAFT_708894 [Trametes gibbosa]|nr:hypothetical protein BC628DRAFT_708894 [Trametes gibbosa]